MEAAQVVSARQPCAAVRRRIIPEGFIVSDGTGTVADGPKAAEALLLDREQCERLIGIAFRRFGIRRQEAEELLSETLLELSACDALVQSPKGFAFHVFHTRCCRWLERARRHREEASGLDPGEGRRLGHHEGDPALALALKQALGRLSPVCRRLLIGYYVEGMSLKETAETTGHSSKQVWKRLNGCLRRLKQCLQA